MGHLDHAVLGVADPRAVVRDGARGRRPRRALHRPRARRHRALTPLEPGCVTISRPVPPAQRPDKRMLRKVIEGLRAL